MKRARIIELGKKVVISDPCYTIPTWCQSVLRNVMPGKYHVGILKSDQGDWGRRNSALMAIHEGHIHSGLKWKRENVTIGVDSGQAGIFDYDSYRNDKWKIKVPKSDFQLFGGEINEGDVWYTNICKLTLRNMGWGKYSHGVACRSGLGDGGYHLYVAKEGRKVVGIMIDFLIDSDHDANPHFVQGKLF